MTGLRIEVDLGKIRHNTRCLVERLKSRGISVTGVTKAVCGHPEIAQAMLDGGAVGLGESRMSNIERLRSAGITGPIALMRPPMLSQVDQVVRAGVTSYNTEPEVISRLAEAARKAGLVHRVVLMVEMGDMRDGIQPENIEGIARQVIAMLGVTLEGIGANFACLGHVAPDAAKMAIFSKIADDMEGACGASMQTVSGGNSSNLPWATGPDATGRTNNLRLGEAILLGVEPVSGEAIDGLFPDAFTLVAEVIEMKFKQISMPGAFTGPPPKALHPAPETARSILAIGTQDTDIAGLTPPEGVISLGATSDHMVVQTIGSHPRVGSELKFQLNYSALMRTMSAPDIAKAILGETPHHNPNTESHHAPRSALV